MQNKLFVGNLDFNVLESELRSAFEEFGAIQSATIISDRMTGRSRGFGFVEYDSAESAQAAIAAMDGTALGGRNITVNVAREREARGDGGGRGGGGRYQRDDRW